MFKLDELRLNIIKPQNLNTNSKKADIKREVIRLNIVKKPENLSHVISSFINTFIECVSVEKQLELIKKTYVPELDDDTKKLYLELFCKIYFHMTWKSHPVKNCLAKLIDNETDFNENIHNYFLLEIQYEREPFCSNKVSVIELPDMITKFGGLLENFKSGAAAFQESLMEIMELFSYALDYYIKALKRTDVSPATRSELCTSIHHSIKVWIHAMQLFCDIWATSGYIPNMGFHKVLRSEEIPIDTKANAGIALVADSKGMKEDPFELLNKNWVHIQNLCIIFGIITHLNKEYLKMYPNALEKILEFLEPAMKTKSHDSSIALFIARAVAQLSKRLESLPNKMTDKITTVCLDYAIQCLDDDLDAVKNTAKETIENLVNIGVRHNPNTIERIFALINTESTNKRHKSVIIACVCQVSGAKFVCDKIPNVQAFLLDSLEDTKNHNTNSVSVLCYEKLMTSRLNNGMDHQIFYDEFITAILNKLRETKLDAFDTRKSLTKLLLRAIKKCSHIVDLLLAEQLPIELRLACLGAAKKSGIFDNRTSTTEEWKSIMPFDEIRAAMVANDDQTRMAALELIVDVHRLTEMFTKEEFNCVLYFLRHNINSEIPALRSQTIGYMRNALYRIENGLNFFKRNPADTRIEYYKKFCHSLASFCFSNFFPGANFGRRTTSLKILLQLFESVKDSSSYLRDELWSRERFDTILNLCYDTYESNKADAVTLLKYCPEKFMHSEDVNLDSVAKMIQSCKPMRSLSGAYYLEFLVFVYNENIFESNGSRVVNAILWLEKLLLKSYETASKSLMKASYQCPLYGELFAMRHLITKTEFIRGDPCTNQWKDFLERFIPFCNKLTEVAAPIVNNSSPEGHLPNDFSSMESYANESDEQILENVTPQMVLLCAWRTVKEVSLILGDISFKMPLVVLSPDSIETGYITVGQVLTIGNHFTTLLSETKHRGAFEQAYVGFTYLCNRLWACDALELHTLPMRWLQALLKIISGETIVADGLDMSVEKLCATRRSAGVPFLMQALVTAELQVGKSTALKFCMENLLKIARDGTGESRTHALNILRALYRCSELSQVVGPFISDGFIVAIQAYDADSWAERNSATLLFSSLMLRVFGVQRQRDTDQLNIRNKMTGRTFFQRYPELYDFFYNILVESQKISHKGNRCRKLHSLLLLLGRLYPSSWEEMESNLSLAEFLPLVSGCTANPELKTRQLAAKIIPTIVRVDKVLPRISYLLDAVLFEKKQKKIKVNSYHGALLQVLYLVRSLNIGEVSQDEQRFKLTQEWMKIQINVSQIHVSHIPVIVTTFCDILLEMYLRIPEVTYQDGLSNIIDEIYKENYEVPGLGHDIMMRKYGTYHFLIHFTCDKIDTETYFTTISNLNYGYDFHESILNLLVLVTNRDNVETFGKELELTDIEISLAHEILKRWGNDTIITAIQASDAFGQYLITTIENNIYHQCTYKAFLLISNSMQYTQLFMTHNNIRGYQSLITLAESYSGQTREAIYACLGKCLKDIIPENDTIDLEFLTSIVSPDNSDNMKRIGIEALRIALDKIDVCTKKVDIPLISTYFWCLFALLRDDESDIRYETAGFVMEMYNKLNAGHENGNILASIATEKLFLLLNSILNKYYTKDEMRLVYETILRLDKEILEVANETNAAIDDANRCFDKNETNLFGENKFVQDECQKYMIELS